MIFYVIKLYAVLYSTLLYSAPLLCLACRAIFCFTLYDNILCSAILYLPIPYDILLYHTVAFGAREPGQERGRPAQAPAELYDEAAPNVDLPERSRFIGRVLGVRFQNYRSPRDIFKHFWLPYQVLMKTV